MAAPQVALRGAARANNMPPSHVQHAAVNQCVKHPVRVLRHHNTKTKSRCNAWRCTVCCKHSHAMPLNLQTKQAPVEMSALHRVHPQSCALSKTAKQTISRQYAVNQPGRANPMCFQCCPTPCMHVHTTPPFTIL